MSKKHAGAKATLMWASVDLRGIVAVRHTAELLFPQMGERVVRVTVSERRSKRKGGR